MAHSDSLQNAGNPHSPAPLSSVTCPVTREQCTEPLCRGGGMCQISDRPPERGKMVVQMQRGDELERQLAAAVEDRDTWKRWAIFFGVGLGLMIWAWVVTK